MGASLGQAREYVVRDHLAGLGYFVMRAPGSKVRRADPAERAPVDLLALPRGGGQVLMVQVKRGAGRLRPVSWNQLLSLAGQYGAVPVLAEAVPRRPVAYWRLLGPKVVGGRGEGSRAQPCQRFDPATWGAAGGAPGGELSDAPAILAGNGYPATGVSDRSPS